MIFTATVMLLALALSTGLPRRVGRFESGMILAAALAAVLLLYSTDRLD